MQRKDLPFVIYRRGPMSFTLVPRGIKGWAQFALWLALVAPLLVWFAEHLAAPPFQRTDFGAVVALFCFGMLAWFVCGMWWMCAHAQVIDSSEHLREKQRARRRQQRKS